KSLLQPRIKVLPEAAAAGDHVLPQPRLAFMDACGNTTSKRRAFERRADALLVHGVAGLMERGEQRIAQIVLLDARGNAHVAGGEFGAKRMMGKIEPPAAEVVTELFRRTG